MTFPENSETQTLKIKELGSRQQLPKQARKRSINY